MNGQDWAEHLISALAEIPTSRCSVRRHFVAMPSLRSATLNSVRWAAMRKYLAALLSLALATPSFAAGCDWRLEPGKLGPLSVGMTIPEAEKALGSSLELIGSDDDTDFFYSFGRCPKSFMVIATNYNTDEESTLRVAMIVAGTISTIDGVHVGSREASLSSLKAKYGERLSRRKTDHYDVVINAYTISAEDKGNEEYVLTYFAPDGAINSIVASAVKYVYRVDIGRPEGRWW